MPEFYRWSGNGFQREGRLLDALELETGDQQKTCESIEVEGREKEKDGKSVCIKEH